MAYDLTAEARSKFGELSAAEEKLLRAAASGAVAYCGPSERDDDLENDPTQAAGWSTDRTVRAKVVSWLCIDAEASRHVDPRGIQVHAARIGNPTHEKDLDFSELTIPFSLSFESCKFELPLLLTGARTRALYFLRTRIESLQGDQLSAAGSIYLREQFHATSEVSLAGARIDGSLDCSGGIFENRDGCALDAEGVKVTGDVVLRENFAAHGEVSFVGADIDGNLDCKGGIFANQAGYALNADGIKVARDLFLCENFRAEGEVSLLGADIGGNLDCSSGTIANQGKDALSADGVRVAGDVSFENSMVTGNLRLLGADIGGQLEISGAKFADACTVGLQSVNVRREFFWKGIGPNTPVELNLSDASVGQIFDEESSWPKKDNLTLEGFVYRRIDGDSPGSAAERLNWLARQPEGFFPQPFRQLAKVLREDGDDAGSRKVLITMENARRRHGGLGWVQWAVAWILRTTIGYGYAPLRALWWIVGFVILGTVLFSWGHMAGVVTRVERKTSPPQIDPFNPFIYSLENFLPLVDLHTAKYWLPDPGAKPIALAWPLSDAPSQTPRSLGRCLRWYLWAHILLGWFFTSMFIAGVTGLVRRE